MRNLAQYPITFAEIYEALEWAKNKALEDGGFGDITQAALEEARKLVENMERE